jgi:secreted PhoX family phosphatase
MTDTGLHSIPTYAELTAARFSRRAVLLGAAGAAAATAFTLRVPGAEAATNGSTLTFPELTKIYDQTHHVASGYDADILVRWGEAIIAGGKDLDAVNQNAADQAKQFGYNCDFIGYLPLPVGSTNSEHGLLCVNNEYPDPHIMFPGLTEDDASKTMTLDQIRTIQQSWGHSIVEIKKVDCNRDLGPGGGTQVAADIRRSDRYQGDRHGL